MSNEEQPKSKLTSDNRVIVDDPKLAEWYEAGFRFAINFLHSSLPAENNLGMTQENFQAHVDGILHDVKIEKDFLETHPVLPGDGIYPRGLCPGPDGTCVDCPDSSLGM